MSNNLKLLTEWLPLSYTSDLVKESKTRNDGKIFLRGVLQKSDTLNQNGRIYPNAILERELRNYQKFIRENRALGECDHPDTSVVELKNASHIIREARMDGNQVVGTIELLNTPAGKILQSLVESGVTLGISSRGVGSTISEGGSQIVQEDFQLICFDMVSEPSTPGAFLMSEGKDVNRSDLDKFFTKSDKIDRIFNDIIDWGDE
jgi:hypothetical protein